MLTLLIAAGIAFMIGLAAGTAGRSQGTRLTRPERRELAAYREFHQTITRRAIDAAAVGDPFAATVVDDANTATRKAQS